jgi:hypothetical protein
MLQPLPFEAGDAWVRCAAGGKRQAMRSKAFTAALAKIAHNNCGACRCEGSSSLMVILHLPLGSKVNVFFLKNEKKTFLAICERYAIAKNAPTSSPVHR